MEDVELELQALEAVYGEDCRVLESYPPRVELLLRPRTADELSQQFVEIVLGIKASSGYPGEPPLFQLVAIKGLDDSRQRRLLAVLSGEAEQLLDEPMLVTISEAAVEFLTENNYPDGECCFCLMPLMMGHSEQPFMKLMTCFHCFHSDCFSRWWNWISSEEQPVYCPVCRAPIHSEAIAHLQQELLEFRKVRDEEETIDLAAELLESEAERQAEFSKFFEAQKSRGGIIEPKGPLSLSLAEQRANESTEQDDERSEEAVPDERSEQGQTHPDEQAQPSQAASDPRSQPDGARSNETTDQAAAHVHLATNGGRSRTTASRRYRPKPRANRTSRENSAWVRKDL